MSHNRVVRSLICLAIVAGVALSGCDAPTATPNINGQGQTPHLPAKPKPAVPVPKSVADVEKLGVPVYPGAVLSEEADSATLDDRTFIRTYKVTMIAPAELPKVLQHYLQGVKDAKHGGIEDFQQVMGKTKDGDSLEVRLGPAADHKKTLIMAWVTQSK